MSVASNPLLQDQPLPAFAKIQTHHIEPALDFLLAENRRHIDALVQRREHSATDFLAQMEQWDDALNKMWAPVSHLHGVLSSAALREVYDRCLPKLTAYATELGQNAELYRVYKELAASAEYGQLPAAQRKAVDNALRDFTLSGIALPAAQQQRFGEIQEKLANASTQFSNNVLDATQGWSKHITDREQLVGVPETALQAYAQAAAAKNLEGYLINLDIPAYLPLLQYGDNRALRQELYQAYTTRASECGPNGGQWDNSALMLDILQLRHELAQLLGFENYAQRSLVTKMADTPAQVLVFLNALAEQTKTLAQREFAELEAFAKIDGLARIEAWDVPYYSEKLRLHKYAISQEELRPYFPSDTVINGLFVVVSKLFQIDFKRADAECWHADVQFYNVLRDGNIIASFYLDLFARENKRGGAWMADCRVRRRLPSGALQLPVALLTCNFTPPTEHTPSLLTHNEVTTLFHEFGHGLHHMLTQIECAAVSGINGVPWDAVELPSQFLENWCWQPEALALISGHYQTGAVLPQALLQKMLAAKNFQAGMQMMRQLEFAIFDLRMHLEYVENTAARFDIQSLLDDVRSAVAVYPLPPDNRFQHSFTHVFAGGYGAGYYSYKWAEVLSADAFSRFEEEGVFNQAVGQEFLQKILERGGSAEPMSLFVDFRGREPTVDALLRHSGVVK